MRSFVEIRLLSEVANDYWQHSFGLLLPSFMFFDLTYSMTVTIIGADSLQLHIYVFFPTVLVCATTLLVYLVPVLAAVSADSKMVLGSMKKGQANLVDTEMVSLQYAKKIIKAQRPFGFKLGAFCFVSLGTGQDIMTNSISYALLIITLVREGGG